MLNDGSALLLGTRQWLTATGRQLRKQGVSPGEEISLSITTDLVNAPLLEEATLDELLASDDLQFLRALEMLDAIPDGTVVLDKDALDAQALVNDAGDEAEAGAEDAEAEVEADAAGED
jgi:C-terminal processing protease CtpA/Prc